MDFSHAFETFVWLHLTLVKVAGAKWSASSTAAYSLLEQSGSCFLDIFTAFNILLPPVCSARGSVCCRCTIPESKDGENRRGFLPSPEFWTCCKAAPHGIVPWHFLFTLCTLDFRFTHVFVVVLLIFLWFLSCGMHWTERWGVVCWQL